MSLRLQAVEGDDRTVDAAALDTAIEAAIIAYNTGRAGESGHARLTLALRDEADAVVGGLCADMYYGWMFVRLLVVPDAHRGQGWGSRLITEAEARARARGLHGIWLDTFGFQARPFYERHGFTCFGTLDDYPPGWQRYFMRKRLDATVNPPS